MKLTVFGASGRVGGYVVQQALEAGHKVTAVVRDPSGFSLRDAGLEVASVPALTEPELLWPALDASDAVISAIGPRGRKAGPVASTATRGILRAMEASGVRRLVALSAVPAGPVPEGESLVNRRLLLPVMKVFARDVFADLAAMEEEIRRSATEWTVLRPPNFVNKPLTGTYRTRIGGNVPRGYSISRADVAHAMLAALDDPAMLRQVVGVVN